LKHFQSLDDKKSDKVLSNLNLKMFLSNTLQTNFDLEMAVSEALTKLGHNLDELYSLETQMACNLESSKYRDRSLKIKLNKGGKISTYGILLNHTNENADTFELCTQEIMEKFRTERFHNVFLDGNINILTNPLNPSKVFGYNPFRATAYDLKVPDGDG